jgi:pilus assembly protein CpaF
MNAALETLNAKIASQIEALPPANPLTLARANGEEGESQIRKIIERVCAGTDLHDRIADEYFAAGPIEKLLADPEVTEIILNGPRSLWFERSGRLQHWPETFLSPLTYRNFISRLSREAGVQASLDCPFADGQWRGCRVHLIIPPASGESAVVTLRKHAQVPWTFERFRDRGWASEAALESLANLVRQKKNFLIVGGTGSGKTSVLSACLASIGKTERTLMIEDTSELPVPNAVSSKLLTRRDPQNLLREIDQSELLKQALRMRPDRLVMGEIRGGEAKDLLMAFATGHSGCMGTLHADSARQALIRLEMLIQLGAPQWNLQAVRTLIWLSVQYVVVVGRREDGARVLDGLYRIASLEEIGFLIEKTV